MASVYCWKYHTPKLELLAIVDDYISFSFERSYSGCGSWQLVLNGSTLNSQRVKGMNFISYGDCAGWVNNTYEEIDNNRKLTFSGIELKGISKTRIVIPPQNETYHTFSGTADLAIKDLLLKHLISPSNSVRVIAGGVVNTCGGAAEIVYNGRYGNLEEEIETIATTHNIGWNAAIVDSQIVWQIYKGVDRTAAQSTNDRLIFDYNYGLIDKSSLNFAESKPNYTIVAGQGEGSERAIETIDDGKTNLERVEVFFDARDIADDSQLAQRGYEKLAQYSDNINYNCELSAQGIQQYRKIFDLGDIGSIRNNLLFDGFLDYRITEAIEVYEGNTVSVSLSIGYNKENLKAAIKRMID